MEYSLGLRLATAAEIADTGANASVGEADALDLDGRLVAIFDEYGTAAWTDGLTRDEAERFMGATRLLVSERGLH